VEYTSDVVVELDGWLVHNTVPQRDADFERDLDSTLDGAAVLGAGFRPALQYGVQDCQAAPATGLAGHTPPMRHHLPDRRATTTRVWLIRCTW